MSDTVISDAYEVKFVQALRDWRAAPESPPPERAWATFDLLFGTPPSPRWTPDDENPYRLPDDLENIFIQAQGDIDRNWWRVSRAMQVHLSQFVPEHRAAARDYTIKRVAVLMGRSEATIREVLHTAEVFAPTFDEQAMRFIVPERDPRNASLAFSHFARAARAGEHAGKVIDHLIADFERTGTRPSVDRARALVDRADRLPDIPHTDEIGVDANQPPGAPGSSWAGRCQAEVVKGSDGLLIRLSATHGFAAGDTVLVTLVEPEEV